MRQARATGHGRQRRAQPARAVHVGDDDAAEAEGGDDIADILGIAIDRVSVKATTTEKLGFTGRREGIAAQAVATIRLPA